MARRSRAQNLLKDYEEIEDYDGTFIVYDFLGFKPSKRFWENIHRVCDECTESGLTQYSVYRENSLKEALIVNQLAQEYGAATMIFRAEELAHKKITTVITVEIITSVDTDEFKACRRHNPSPQGTRESRDQSHK